MKKNLNISVLLDFYGELVTKKQREMLELYYDQDLSLAEIAEGEGITRQGVRDAIKRGETVLLELEEKLALAARWKETEKKLEEISVLAARISEQNLKTSMVFDIEKCVEKIKDLCRNVSVEE